MLERLVMDKHSSLLRKFYNIGTLTIFLRFQGDDFVVGEVENGGRLGSSKGCNFPGLDVPFKAISPQDEVDIKFGVDNDVDVIFASFVRDADDVKNVRKLLSGKNIFVVAKIEDFRGCKNIDDVIEASDGILVSMI
jgi:pyruvate kinase